MRLHHIKLPISEMNCTFGNQHSMSDVNVLNDLVKVIVNRNNFEEKLQLIQVKFYISQVATYFENLYTTRISIGLNLPHSFFHRVIS